MCGIAGIVDKTGLLSPDILDSYVRLMANTMIHRGPDDYGFWTDPNGFCAFAQRRLAIIDTSSGGHQPMVSQDGRHVLTYNGELYNFHDLKSILEAKGHQFSSRSDTEVLLAALVDQGAAVLPDLDAMFAFGFWDSKAKHLLLARDMFGEKPLYIYETPEILAFASELQALTELPQFDATIDQEAIANYLCFQYIPAPGSIYRAVKKLPPGSALDLAVGGESRLTAYFHFKTSAIHQSNRTIDDQADELDEILTRTIERRLISDVPLGAFLSGGVDSTVVAAMIARKLGRSLDTFSIGFSGHADSEHLLAAETAAHLGTRHHERILMPDALDLGHAIGRALDEPNADSSCLPTFLLSGFAREHVTVALSGDGGDELFGGYGRYFSTVDEESRQIPGWTPGGAYLSDRILVYPERVLSEILGTIPPGLAHTLQTERMLLDEDPRPLVNRLRELDARHYMPGAVLAKVDRMSMRHSLEVRAPLIGREVAHFAMGLAADDCYKAGTSSGKTVLKRVAERYVPRGWLDRPKRGFGLPMDGWGKAALLPTTRTLVLSPQSALRQFIDPTRLDQFLKTQEQNFSAYRVWSLFILETWLQEHPYQALEAPLGAVRPTQSAVPRTMVPSVPAAPPKPGVTSWLKRLFGRTSS